MNKSPTQILVDHYEGCLARYGPTLKGVDWPNHEDARKRYEIMWCLSLMAPSLHDGNHSVLDYGCGVGHYLGHLQGMGGAEDYTGYDASSKMIAEAQAKFPNAKFTDSWGLVSLSKYDYVIMNGVFTVKVDMDERMMRYFLRLELRKAWALCKVGLAFNIMTPHTTREPRADLYHASIDEVTAFVSEELSRNFVVRHDYGLWEYTVYVYRGEAAQEGGTNG